MTAERIEEISNSGSKGKDISREEKREFMVATGCPFTEDTLDWDFNYQVTD